MHRFQNELLDTNTTEVYNWVNQYLIIMATHHSKYTDEERNELIRDFESRFPECDFFRKKIIVEYKRVTEELRKFEGPEFELERLYYLKEKGFIAPNHQGETAESVSNLWISIATKKSNLPVGISYTKNLIGQWIGYLSNKFTAKKKEEEQNKRPRKETFHTCPLDEGAGWPMGTMTYEYL